MDSKRKNSDIGADKQVIRGSGLIGPSDSGVPTLIDVKDGKITRIRPLHYEMNYDKKDFNAWKIEARGKALEPPMKGMVGPIGLAYKKRVYSKNRVRYPLEAGRLGPQRRAEHAEQGQERLCAHLVGRGRRIGGVRAEAGRRRPTDLKRSSPRQTCTARACTSAPATAARTGSSPCSGGYTIQMRNLDSWEGQNWGAKHVWGCEPVGEMMPAANLYPDIAEHGELLLFWGCDPETTAYPINGMMASRLCYWLTEIGLKSVYICPDLNYGAGVHADKWIPILPNTDAALHLAIAYVWITEGTYDKEYIAAHSYGFDKFEDYVLGKNDGLPKTPAWASEKCGVPEWTIKALARDWANKIDEPYPRQRRTRHQRALLFRACPPGSHAPRHAGPRQTGCPPGEDDRMGPVGSDLPHALSGQGKG